MKRRVLLIAVFAALALSGGIVLAARWAMVKRQASLPSLPTSAVPDAWHDYHKAPGHVVHVDREGLACNKCHVTQHGFEPPSMQVCAGCHEARANIRHAVAILPPDQQLSIADCTACHGFGPEQSDRRERCIRCHELPQGQLAPIEQHASVVCTTCHRPHDAQIVQPAPCLSCHATSENHHGKAAPDSAQNCLTCHDAHQPARLAADRCIGCHDKPQALSAQGHTQCTGCHVPHGFAENQTRDCRSCHQTQHVLGEQRSAAHADCKSCHDPHAPTPVSETRCTTCHAQVTPTHPPHDGRTCLTCHQVHDHSAAPPTAQPCTGCHQQAHADQGKNGPHGGHALCIDCHQPHAFAHPAVPGACSNCHAQQLTAAAQNRGHASAACTGCHAGDVHAAQNPPKACTSCHQQIHPRAEHAECTSCHEPHSGAPRSVEASCKQCHATQEHVLAPAHKQCLTCHNPHSGTLPAIAQCTHCHEQKMHQNHAQLSGGCTSCHKLHVQSSVQSAPTCTSCHDLTSLPGLHRNPAHQNCTTCHEGAHDKGPYSDRATCVSCHKAQQNHVPEAQLCQGCHVFRQ